MSAAPAPQVVVLVVMYFNIRAPSCNTASAHEYSTRTAIVCFVPILRAMERTFQTHTVHTNFRTRRPQTLQRNLCTRRFLCHAHKTHTDTHARIKSITFFSAVRERMRAPRLHQGKLCLFGMYNTFVAVIRTSDQSVFIPAARGRMRIPLAPPGEGIQFLACVMHFYSVKHQSNHFFLCRSEAHEDSLGSTRGKYTIFNMYNAFLMLGSL